MVTRRPPELGRQGSWRALRVNWTLGFYPLPRAPHFRPKEAMVRALLKSGAESTGIAIDAGEHRGLQRLVAQVVPPQFLHRVHHRESEVRVGPWPPIRRPAPGERSLQ